MEVLRDDVLGDVAHGFLTRRGGMSQGVYAGLNCGIGSGDDPAVVAANRMRAAAAVLPGAPLVGVYQVHSARCATLAAPWAEADRPHADAVVTARPGVLLGILTADCAPVLLADAAAGVVGAAHAGWRGALDGVVAAAVAAMVRLGAHPARIAAAIGPCIAQASYEVDGAFRDRFVADAADGARHFVPGRGGRYGFDLAGYVAARLGEAGVCTVSQLGLDTYADADRFFSYRRATHRGEAAYGRQIALIGLGDSG